MSNDLRIKNQLNSASNNLKGKSTETFSSGLKMSKTISKATPQFKAMPLKSVQDQRMFNNVTIKLVKGSIEKEGTKVSAIEFML